MPTIPASLLFRNNRTYGVGVITFDLILTESHNFSNSVTQFNVEDGSLITDHIRNELFTGTVSGLITNFSLFQNGFFSNRAQEAFDAINVLWKERTLVDIVTVMKAYKNVSITNITMSRDSDSGEELIVDFSFQEVNVVTLQEVIIEATIKLPNMNTDQNRQSSPNLNVGKQQGVVR